MLSATLNVLILGVLSSICAAAQTETHPLTANYCEVVASPADYNGRVLSVKVILSPSYHSLFLYGVECVPKEGYDVTTEAILPSSWESLPNGKKLRGLLKHGRKARVTLVGTFESSKQRLGLDGQRFRFSISQIQSVSPYRDGRE